MNHRHRWAFALTAIGLIWASTATAADSKAGGYALSAKVEVPGNKVENFDIGFVDAQSGRYFLADRSNASVDVVDTKTNALLYKIGGFVGDKGKKGGEVGPDGVLVIPEANELWAGDGDSTLKVYDLGATPPKLVATISTGGKFRVDELDYDAKDGVVLAANNADKPAFLSLISTKPDHKILAKVELPQASDGIEQPAYVAETGLFYFSVPIVDEEKTKGAVGVFDPVSAKVTKMISVENCNPTGLKHGPGLKLVVGCAAGSKETGMKPATVILDLATGTSKALPQIGGEDEVWYDPTPNQYFTASRDMPGGPVLGVIDAATDRWVENVPTAKNAHSVAADSLTGAVYVPLTPNPNCPNGCIGVFTRP